MMLLLLSLLLLLFTHIVCMLFTSIPADNMKCVVEVTVANILEGCYDLKVLVMLLCCV